MRCWRLFGELGDGGGERGGIVVVVLAIDLRRDSLR